MLGKAREVTAKARLLVVVSSSGDFPFLDIERRGQIPTFGADQVDGVECVWVESDPRLSSKWAFRCANYVLSALQLNLSGHPLEVMVRNYSYFFGQGRVRREVIASEERPSSKNFRVRVNWSHLMAWSYSPQRNWNGFSRTLARILSWLADGKPRVSAERVTLNYANSYFLTTWRSFLRYEAVLELFDFDFVLFTTSTCYVDLLRLVEVADSLPKCRVYAGDVMRFSVPFVAGNSVLLSRDVVESIVRHKDQYRLDLPDDVSLGLLVRDFGLADLVSIPTETLPFVAQIPEDLSRNPSKPYLFRCKAEPSTRNPDPVIQTMLELHTHILGSRGVEK